MADFANEGALDPIGSANFRPRVVARLCCIDSRNEQSRMLRATTNEAARYCRLPQRKNLHCVRLAYTRRAVGMDPLQVGRDALR